MARHAKNNTASSYFTYAERSKLDYGTKKERLGSDSLKDFDSCCLCLRPAVTPLACRDGHLFCKECIYQNVLAQKEEIARQVARYEAQQKHLQEEAEEKERLAERAKLDAFEKTEGSLRSQQHKVFRKLSEDEELNSAKRPKISQHSVAAIEGPRAPLLLENGSSNGKSANPASDSAASATVVSTQQPSQAPVEEKERHKQLTAFWIPYLTPDAKPTLMEAPCRDLKCPEGQHVIRLKQLIDVQFTASRNMDRTDPLYIKNARYQCPACMKQLTNAPKAAVLQTCGHVYCSGCIAKFIRPDLVCTVCNGPLKPEHIINLQSGGTGFAGHGDNLQATKWTPMMGFG